MPVVLKRIGGSRLRAFSSGHAWCWGCLLAPGAPRSSCIGPRPLTTPPAPPGCLPSFSSFAPGPPPMCCVPCSPSALLAPPGPLHQGRTQPGPGREVLSQLLTELSLKGGSLSHQGGP